MAPCLILSFYMFGSFPSGSFPLHCPDFFWHVYRLFRPYVQKHLRLGGYT